MSALHIFEALCGLISIYIGIRFILAKEIPIVSEGGSEPMGWLRDWEAIAVGIVAICIGLACLAASLDYISLG
jgi:hypothetical protein